MTEIDQAQLRQSLEHRDDSFARLLSLIPAKYYIVDTPEEADSKWMKNKKKRTADEVTSTRKKAKFEKFDPENNKSILEIQAERAFLAKQNDDHRLADKNIAFKPMQPTASISTLRQKLQDKIDSFRKHRHAPETDRAASPVSDELSEVQLELGAERSDNGDDNETLASRDEMLEARRKRRGEVRDNRRRKRKEERRADKDGAKKDSKSNGKSVNSDASKPDFTAKSGKNVLLVNVPAATLPNPNLESHPGSNLSFPTLSLPSASHSKSHTHLKSISNPTQALAHLQAQKNKTAELPEDKRLLVEDKERWGKMLQRAEGGKVRDDETRLKKAERRMEKQKAKSGKEWSERKRQADHSQAIKAKKRNENIANRSEAKKNKKLGLKPKGDKDKAGGKGKPGYKGKPAGKPDGKGKGKPGF